MIKKNIFLSLILTGFLTQVAFAQNTEAQLQAATSTPFSIEEKNTRALISKDRPKLQSFIELEEEIKDNEIDQKDMEFKLKHLKKLSRKIELKQQKIEQKSKRLEALSQQERLESSIEDLKGKIGNSTGAEKKLTLEAKLANKQAKLNRKKSKAESLEIEIIKLERKLAVDQQLIETHVEARKEKLGARLNKTTVQQANIAQKIDTLIAKRTGTEDQTKFDRIDKQLANKQHQAEKLEARKLKIIKKLDEINLHAF